MMHRWTPRVGIPCDYMFTVRIWMLVCTPTAASGRDVARHGDSIVDCFKHGRDAIFAVNSINVAYRSWDGADVPGDDASRVCCPALSLSTIESRDRHFSTPTLLLRCPARCLSYYVPLFVLFLSRNLYLSGTKTIGRRDHVVTFHGFSACRSFPTITCAHECT